MQVEWKGLSLGRKERASSRVVYFLLVLTLLNGSEAKEARGPWELKMQLPDVILENVPFSATIQLLRPTSYETSYPFEVMYTIQDGLHHSLMNGTFQVQDTNDNPTTTQLSFLVPVEGLMLPRAGHELLLVHARGHHIDPHTHAIHETNWQGSNVAFCLPGFLSLLPPLVTLIVSAMTSQVHVALILGIWCGATIVNRGNVFTGFLRTFDSYWVQAFTYDNHAGILLFTIILGGTIGLVQKGGGGQGLARCAMSFMTSRLRMQLAAWLLCLVIFFDDYSCILIVGSSLRTVLKETGVSREKLAAIIHFIGVCLPSIAPVSSWIGVEIGYVSAQLKQLNLDWDPYVTCLHCIQYRFFPVLVIIFVFIFILFERDFGPLVESETLAVQEKRDLDILTGLEFSSFPGQNGRESATTTTTTATATTAAAATTTAATATAAAAAAVSLTAQSGGKLDPKPGTPLRWFNAVIPFAVIVITTFVGMLLDGYSTLHRMRPVKERPEITWLNALSHCDSVAALLRSSAGGWLVALVLLWSQRIVNLSEAMQAWVQGIQEVLDPTIVLLLAWALGNVIQDLKTAAFLSTLVRDDVPVGILPGCTALLCYVVSFATGSAFGTMAIMFPIVSPLAFRIGRGDREVLLQCFGSILGGSVFGNTCSPIADTSVLTSLATQISLTAHLRTILPYAILVGSVALVVGSFLVGMGVLSVFTSYGISLAALIVFLVSRGQNVTSSWRFDSMSSWGAAFSPSSLFSPSRSETEPLI